MERMNFQKTDHSNRSNGQFLFGFIYPRLCYQLLTPGNLQSAWTEGDRCCLPVAPCQSNWLTSLGIATRWQTVVLLLSMLCIIIGTANLSSWFPVFLF